MTSAMPCGLEALNIMAIQSALSDFLNNIDDLCKVSVAISGHAHSRVAVGCFNLSSCPTKCHLLHEIYVQILALDWPTCGFTAASKVTALLTAQVRDIQSGPVCKTCGELRVVELQGWTAGPGRWDHWGTFRLSGRAIPFPA